MTPFRKNNESLSSVLLSLYYDEATGEVIVKDEERKLKFYFLKGHLIYAEGLDTDSQLLREVASRKKLDQKQIDELARIKENAPHSLADTLLEMNLISKEAWNKFIIMKVKYILSYALTIESTEIVVNNIEPEIPNNCRLDYNFLQLFLETLRGVKNLSIIKKNVPDNNAVYKITADAGKIASNIPLTPSEKTVFSAIDGKRDINEIMTLTHLDKLNVQRILFTLICLDLIFPLDKREERETAVNAYNEILDIYFDLIGIIVKNLEKEIGKEFQNVFYSSKVKIEGNSGGILKELDLSNDSKQFIMENIIKDFPVDSHFTEGRLFISSSFNKLIFLLIMEMKKLLGTGITENSLHEMVDMIGYIGKYQRKNELINYIKGNIEDYLRQIESS